MTFPVYLHIGPLRLHPHWVFETLAYAVAFRLYLQLRKRQGDTLSDDARWWIVAAAAAGAAAGAKVLHWLENPAFTFANWHDPAVLFGGKTVVGALIGGLAAVEWTKRRIGIRSRTGDLFALPLAVGIAIGRIGCFLTGTEDDPAGIRTSLPWGVNFGDGPRHPTQIYEIVFLILLAAILARLSRKAHPPGDLFKVFMVAYFSFRLAIDFLKPEIPIYLGLSTLQWGCVAMLGYYSRDIYRWCAAAALHAGPPVATPAAGFSEARETRP